MKNAPLTRPGPRRPLAAAAIVGALTLVAVAAPAGGDPICFSQGATVCGVFSTLPRDSVNCATTSSTFAWDWSQWYVSMDRAGYLIGCDTLTIIGLPTGEPVLLRARVRAIADFDAVSSPPPSGFTYDLWFYGPHHGITMDGIVNPGDPPIHYDLVQEMPLACVGGVPFALNLQFNGGGHPGSVARFRSLLEFLDLPEAQRSSPFAAAAARRPSGPRRGARSRRTGADRRSASAIDALDGALRGSRAERRGPLDQRETTTRTLMEPARAVARAK